jgi:hypothetical protein
MPLTPQCETEKNEGEKNSQWSSSKYAEVFIRKVSKKRMNRWVPNDANQRRAVARPLNLPCWTVLLVTFQHLKSVPLVPLLPFSPGNIALKAVVSEKFATGLLHFQ